MMSDTRKSRRRQIMTKRTLITTGLSMLVWGFSVLSWPSISNAVEARLTDDAHTSSAQPNQNFGASPSLEITSTQNTYIKFDLSPLPSGTVGSDVAKATLKIWVRRVTTTGSFDIRRVAGAWIEESITANTAPSLGAIEATPTVTEVRSFIVVELTQLVKDWLDGMLANNGIALVPVGAIDVALDSKEDPRTGNEPMLHVTLARVGGSGTANTIPKFTAAATLGNSVITDNNGNVGIGTATPGVALHIDRTIDTNFNAGSGDTHQIIFVRNPSSTASPAASGIRFSAGPPSNPGVGAIGVVRTGGDAGALFFITGNVGPTSREQMRITAGGEVGIGTVSPADLLHVAGDVRVGTGTTGCVKDADATVIAGTCSSDLRMKANVQPFGPVLDKLIQLQPVSFQWKANEYPELHLGRSRSFGLVAEEVEEVLPELVTQDAKGYKAVRYNKLPFLLLQALKEQQAQIRQLQAENETLKHRLDALETKRNRAR